MVLDPASGVRRAATVWRDDFGAVALIEESPSSIVDSPRLTVDISPEMQDLLSALSECASDVGGLSRATRYDLDGLDAGPLLQGLNGDLAPSLAIAVVGERGDQPNAWQSDLLEALRGLSIVGTASISSELLSQLKPNRVPRKGGIIWCGKGNRVGLDSSYVDAVSVQTKSDSVRRTLIRKQLAVPLPFDLERRRLRALARLSSGTSDSEVPILRELLDEESERASALANRIHELEGMLDLALDEHDDALSDLDGALSKVRFLEKAFREMGEYPLATTEEDEELAPETVSDALYFARQALTFLVIGPTDKFCNELDKHTKRSLWAKKIWAALRALNDYCRSKAAKTFHGDLTYYRANPPGGTIPLLAEYAPKESEATSNDPDLRSIRTFAVPREVDPNAQIYMDQHLKIDKGGPVAPRIHFYDHSGGSTERIHVGYIGPHLPTSGGF